MTEIETRLGRLEATQEFIGDHIREIRASVSRIENTLAERRGATRIFRGLPAALWLAVATAAAAWATGALHLPVAH